MGDIKLINCPACDKKVSIEASACPGCGQPLTKETTPIESNEENETLAPCAACDKKIPLEAAACPYCGKSYAQANAAQPIKKKKWKVWQIIGLVFAAFLVISVFSGRGDKERAEEMRKAKEAGFIALSEGNMNYADAVAFCRKHGGRLPRINKSDSWDGNNPSPRGILIDGFGYGHRPRSEVGLPAASKNVYWTGTSDPHHQGYLWVLVDGYNSVVGFVSGNPKIERRVACVP